MSIPRCLTLLLLTGLPLSAGAGVAGRWTTDFGAMDLQQQADQLSGRYGEDEGQLSGVLRNGVFRGYWTERASDRPCASPGPGGSHHWGRIELTFEGNRFRGRWSYCDEPAGSGGSWNGQRDADAPSPPADTTPSGSRHWVLDQVRVETPEPYLKGGPCRLLTADTADDGMRLHYRCTDPNTDRDTDYAANFDYQIRLPSLLTPDSPVSAEGRLIAQSGDFSASCALGPAVLVPTLIASAGERPSDQGSGEANFHAPWCDDAGNCPTLELSCVVSSTQELRRTWVYRWQP